MHDLILHFSHFAMYNCCYTLLNPFVYFDFINTFHFVFFFFLICFYSIPPKATLRQLKVAMGNERSNTTIEAAHAEQPEYNSSCHR